MPDFLAFLLRLLTSPFRSTIDLEIEVLALRHQLAIYQRSIPRPRLRLRDRLFWFAGGLSTSPPPNIRPQPGRPSR
jgi:hypothetical protein